MTFDPNMYKPENLDYGQDSFSEETPHLQRVTLATFGLFGIPNTFLDVGCGMGQCVDMARLLGVNAQGVELHPRPGYLQHDLRYPMPSVFPGGAEMVFCWEVGEHLPEESADTLCKSIADNLTTGGVLVWTAAIPGQAGLGHINCQIPWYWGDKFGRVGLNRSVQMTAALAFLWEFAAGGYMYHLRQNLNVFVKV
jgi:hypothetical protein